MPIDPYPTDVPHPGRLHSLMFTFVCLFLNAMFRGFFQTLSELGSPARDGLDGKPHFLLFPRALPPPWLPPRPGRPTGVMCCPCPTPNPPGPMRPFLAMAMPRPQHMGASLKKLCCLYHRARPLSAPPAFPGDPNGPTQQRFPGEPRSLCSSSQKWPKTGSSQKWKKVL